MLLSEVCGQISSQSLFHPAEVCISNATRMKLEFQTLGAVVQGLTASNIGYLLTGSFALNYYAVPRMTRDIDMVVELDLGDVDRIMRLFEHDFYVDRDAVFRAISSRAMFNIMHLENAVKVDFIVKKQTEYEDLKFRRRILVTVDDIDLWIISKEDLIISKLQWAQASHSEFQLRDVRNLLATDYDFDYVRQWSQKLSVMDLLSECLNE
jgi:hypothetical protein